MKARRSSLAILPLLAVPAAAQSLVLAVDGAAPGDRLGASVSAAGDVDGDAVPDFVVGSPGDAQFQARLISGATGRLIHGWSVSSLADGFGKTVAGLGDVNGDTIPDVAVGASDENYVRLLSGADGATLQDLQIDHALVARAGDLDGDDRGDLLAAEPGWLGAFSGATGNMLWERAGPWSFAWVVDDVGDVNADGHDDVVTSAWAESSNGPESGTVYVLSGADGAALWTVPGFDAWHWFGDDVAGVGDVDGDGVPDFGGLARIEQLLTSEPPYARVYSGATGGLLLHVLTSQTTGTVELQDGVMCRAGDADGDGRGDFLAGGRPWTGGHELALYSGLDGRRLWDADFGHSAQAIDFVGDTDGDGIAELVLGDADAAPNGADSGRVELREVYCVPPAASYCPAAPNSAGPGAQLSFHGALSVSENDFTLDSSGAVPNAHGVFFYGPDQQMLPFGDGFRCVGPGGVGVFRLNPPLPTTPAGTLSRQVDFSLPPAGGGGSGAIAPGSTWNFQHWFRDVPAMQTGFNLSGGLSVTFCP